MRLEIFRTSAILRRLRVEAGSMFIPLKREDTVRPLVFYEAGIRENLCSGRHILHKWQRTGGSGEGCRRGGKSSGLVVLGMLGGILVVLRRLLAPLVDCGLVAA